METTEAFKNRIYGNRMICDYDEYWEKHFMKICINIGKKSKSFRVLNWSNLNQDISACYFKTFQNVYSFHWEIV